MGMKQIYLLTCEFVSNFWPNIQELIFMKIGLIDAKGMDESQSVWLSGYPSTKGHFEVS